MTNSLDNGYKWTTLELDIFSNSINDIKNKIDNNLGGYATGRKPKRASMKCAKCKGDLTSVNSIKTADGKRVCSTSCKILRERTDKI